MWVKAIATCWTVCLFAFPIHWCRSQKVLQWTFRVNFFKQLNFFSSTALRNAASSNKLSRGSEWMSFKVTTAGKRPFPGGHLALIQFWHSQTQKKSSRNKTRSHNNSHDCVTTDITLPNAPLTAQLILLHHQTFHYVPDHLLTNVASCITSEINKKARINFPLGFFLIELRKQKWGLSGLSWAEGEDEEESFTCDVN